MYVHLMDHLMQVSTDDKRTKKRIYYLTDLLMQNVHRSLLVQEVVQLDELLGTGHGPSSVGAPPLTIEACLLYTSDAADDC